MNKTAIIISGHISRVTPFEDGNVSYTFLDSKTQELYRFTEPTAMSDTKGRGLLRGSQLQAELFPVLDANDQPVVREFDMDNGDKGKVIVCRLGRWYLEHAALSADDKRISAPLIAEDAKAPETVEA